MTRGAASTVPLEYSIYRQRPHWPACTGPPPCAGGGSGEIQTSISPGRAWNSPRRWRVTIWPERHCHRVAAPRQLGLDLGAHAPREHAVAQQVTYAAVGSGTILSRGKIVLR